MHIDKFLHNKLIIACQDLEACKYACYKPAESVAGLINDLQSSITTYEATSRPQDTQAFTTNLQPKGYNQQKDFEPTDAYFTDRRFYHRPYQQSQNQHSQNQPRNSYNQPSNQSQKTKK